MGKLSALFSPGSISVSPNNLHLEFIATIDELEMDSWAHNLVGFGEDEFNKNWIEG